MGSTTESRRLQPDCENVSRNRHRLSTISVDNFGEILPKPDAGPAKSGLGLDLLKKHTVK